MALNQVLMTGARNIPESYPDSGHSWSKKWRGDPASPLHFIYSHERWRLLPDSGCNSPGGFIYIFLPI